MLVSSTSPNRRSSLPSPSKSVNPISSRIGSAISAFHADGRGVERARISIADVTGPFHIQTGTDGLGAFEFRDLAPGSYVVTVYWSGYDVVTRPILLQASMEGLTVMLEPSSGQTVSVRNRETGVPLRSVQIEATDGSTTAKFLVPYD